MNPQLTIALAQTRQQDLCSSADRARLAAITSSRADRLGRLRRAILARPHRQSSPVASGRAAATGV
ncbi:MAG: hypothetical protein WBQ18_07115 [Solirubrobacteraceae bacterium]